MAVTVIDKPSQFDLNTVSNGFTYELQSDKTAEDNFRYTFEITVNGTLQGTKRVPSTGTNTIVDLKEVLQPFISSFVEFSSGGFVWDITDVEVDDENPGIREVDIIVGDQYELAGAIITSVLPVDNFECARGFSVLDEYEFPSRFETTAGPVQRMIRGVNHFVPFGIYDKSGGSTVSVIATYKDKNGVGIGGGSYSRVFDLVDPQRLICYVPIGTSNAVTAMPVNTYFAEFQLQRVGNPNIVLVNCAIYDDCFDNLVTLVFRNKYFQYSQLSFDAINAEIVNKTKDRWESQTDGLTDFNVKGYTDLKLTTRYGTEEEFSEIEDLILSDDIYIQETGERVVIEQSSLDKKTRLKDKVINYTMSVRKSNRIFRP